MIKYGLKLWSCNKQWFNQAIALFESGKIDFIELYIVPELNFSADSERFKFFKDIAVFKGIPVSIHSPHHAHKFNVFQLDAAEIKLFREQVIGTADFLNSRFIVLHAGVGRSRRIFKENTAKLYDRRLLIENMSRVGLGGKIDFGYSLDELRFIKDDCGFNICFDFVHAVKTALSEKRSHKDFIKKLVAELKPAYFHICGTKFDKLEDEHLNLFDGDFDIAFVKKILLDTADKKDVHLVFEVPKQSDGLQNDLKNMDYFKKL